MEEEALPTRGGIGRKERGGMKKRWNLVIKFFSSFWSFSCALSVCVCVCLLTYYHHWMGLILCWCVLVFLYSGYRRHKSDREDDPANGGSSLLLSPHPLILLMLLSESLFASRSHLSTLRKWGLFWNSERVKELLLLYGMVLSLVFKWILIILVWKVFYYVSVFFYELQIV